MKSSGVFRAIALLSVFAWLCSCGGRSEEDEYVITPDFDGALTLDLSTAERKTVLEDTVLIPNITNILFFGERMYCRVGFNSLYCYDTRSGAFLYQVSRKGRAGNEYVKVYDMWIQDGRLAVLDGESNKVLLCNVDTGEVEDYVYITDTDRHFSYAVQLDGGHVVGHTTFSETPKKALALFDNSTYRYVRDVSDRDLLSGFGYDKMFTAGNVSGVLYAPYFDNKVYSVDGEEVRLRYVVDFGGRSFPMEGFANEFEMLQEFVTSDKPYVTLISSMYETEGQFCFAVLGKEEEEARFYAVLYDKAGRRSRVVTFESGSGEQNFKLNYHEGDLHVLALSADEDRWTDYQFSIDKLLTFKQ